MDQKGRIASSSTVMSWHGRVAVAATRRPVGSSARMYASKAGSTHASQSNLWSCPRDTMTCPTRTFGRDVAASHPFNCCCDHHRRCGVTPFQLLLRAAETGQHSDGHVDGASTSRVVLISCMLHQHQSWSTTRSVLRCSCASRRVLRTSSVLLCTCASGGIRRTSSVLRYCCARGPAVFYVAPAHVVENIASAPSWDAAPASVVKYTALALLLGTSRLRHLGTQHQHLPWRTPIQLP